MFYVYKRQEEAEGSACVRFMRGRRKQREVQEKRGCYKYERQREEREQQAKSVCYNVAMADVRVTCCQSGCMLDMYEGHVAVVDVCVARGCSGCMRDMYQLTLPW